MILMVGLGNKGEKYKNNRHNLGFMVLDSLAESLGIRSSWLVDSELKSAIFRISGLPTPNSRLILMKPYIFMNNSGAAVKKAMEKFDIGIEDLWVVHDDLDLPFLNIRIQKGRGSAGHRGVQSVINEIGEDFLRFRIGVGRPSKGEDSDEYLLSDFSRKELSLLKKTTGLIIKVINFALEEGWEKTASHFSGKDLLISLISKI